MYWLIGLGIATGMRTMTPMAVVCWCAYLGLLPQTGWSFWAGNLITVIVFTLLALGEYVGDTLPMTPNRTAPGPLAARIVFGGLTGALVAHATMPPVAGGVVFGVIGALIGAFGGIRIRLWVSRRVGRDLPVALTESAIALALALGAASAFHGYWMVMQADRMQLQ
jgi:uncharacterized membrane protein